MDDVIFVNLMVLILFVKRDYRESFDNRVSYVIITFISFKEYKEKIMATMNHGAIDNKQLVTLIERIEKINEEMAAYAADLKEIMAEAKSAGFDPKYIRQMISLRKMDPDELSERDELTQIYRNALGL